MVAARRLVVAVLSVAAAVATASALAAGSGVRRPGPPPRVFAFLSSAGGSELTELARYGARIDVVAPEWYSLSVDSATLSGGPSAAVEALARSEGDQLWPVVNATLAGGRPLGRAAARARMAGAIAAEVQRRGYAGVTLDVEQLDPVQSADYTTLVATLAARLHAGRERLAVYVPRRSAGGGAVAYDWPALARAADLLIGSGYNEHYAEGSPGPVTTAAGFAATLDYAAGVSRTRVAPAIGAFGYSWPRNGRGSAYMVSTLAAQQLRDRLHASLHGAAGDAWFDAGGRVVHYQSGAALAARARDARDVGMRWLALFSLGREPAWFWTRITTARQAGDRAQAA